MKDKIKKATDLIPPLAMAALGFSWGTKEGVILSFFAAAWILDLMMSWLKSKIINFYKKRT